MKVKCELCKAKTATTVLVSKRRGDLSSWWACHDCTNKQEKTKDGHFKDFSVGTFPGYELFLEVRKASIEIEDAKSRSRYLLGLLKQRESSNGN